MLFLLAVLHNPCTYRAAQCRWERCRKHARNALNHFGKCRFQGLADFSFDKKTSIADAGLDDVPEYSPKYS